MCRALEWVQRTKEINESEESVQQLFPHVLKLSELIYIRPILAGAQTRAGIGQ